ncbi:MAG TPA: methylated-DNA--[protein]-cysteine S-methyltransferase [Ktedonobacterales bacterium]
MTTAVREELVVGTVRTWAGTTRVTASPRGVREVWLPNWRGGEPEGAPPVERAAEISAPAGDGPAHAHLRQALAELADYFAGTRRAFTVALDPAGNDFFRAVWAAVARVPYGETRSYGEIARAIGAPGAARAVGAANGANPVAPFVPCHRIVGSDGRLVGYGPGLPLKLRLLRMEDALPASAAEYGAWAARVAARLGGERIVLGVRSSGVACRPECGALARHEPRPARIFRDPAAAVAAGFRPCALCRPDQPVLVA